ncbi:hypothetical protein HPB48_009061 [Haemaphysalis longicornis]|uniref:Uncharacterized protein n=1 Tax=Haemaphysalis longicornis TaxID=44386 RepID=A0A9J6FXH5_HAELO|nr:hypothetical protein HPB48_009061 [Haemaphysalis longicornis]
MKTWEAVYKGHVLVSAPRVAALAKDAVPTRFPGCPAHLTKTEKKRKAPADRSLPPTTNRRRVRLGNATSFEKLSPTENSQACDVVSKMDEGDGVGSDAVAFDTTPVTVSAINLIEDVFENANSVPLPTAAWACHKVEVDGLSCFVKFS